MRRAAATLPRAASLGTPTRNILWRGCRVQPGHGLSILASWARPHERGESACLDKCLLRVLVDPLVLVGRMLPNLQLPMMVPTLWDLIALGNLHC